MKNKMKKACSILAALSIAGAMAVPAFAAEYPVNESDSIIPISGEIRVTTLAAVVPVSSSFVIDANQAEGSRFISPNLSVQNKTSAPIDVYGVSMKSKDAASPKVVAQDANADWDNINTVKAESEIAFAIIDGDKTSHWFKAEADQAAEKLFSVDSEGTEADNSKHRECSG